MYKIAILGCENSHANTFLDFIIKDKLYTDVEVVGVYSDDTEAANKLNEEYGVYVAESYDEFVGKVDGVVITARHGDNHYKYAKPYIASGIPMFIDKPITVSESDAAEFMAELKKNNIRVCGGSVCTLAPHVQELKKIVEQKSQGEVFGGLLRAPVSMDNIYGGFFFYSQHLTEVMCEIFGFYPNSVQTFRKNKTTTVVVRYDDYDVCLEYVNDVYNYYASVSCEKQVVGSPYEVDNACFELEFKEFYDLLCGGKQEKSYEDFFAPVYILNAINRSIQSGKEEKINRVG